MNLFNDTTLNSVFDSMAKEIKINDMLVPSIVTSGALNKYRQETKHIHTIEKISQGDIVAYEGNKYLVVSESMSKRHNKYKNIMEHCNISLVVKGELLKVKIGNDVATGRPIYEETQLYYDEESVVRFNNIGSTSGTNSWLTIEKALEGIVQKNEKNLHYLDVGTVLNIQGENFEITHVDKVQTGIMVLKMEYKI